MKKLLPLHGMAVNFGLVSESMQPKRGRKSYFTPEVKVALMFLKMYSQLSMPKLREQLNANIHYQIFCVIAINPAKPLTNYTLPDDIATELAAKLKIQQQQCLLAEMWKPYMKNQDTVFTHATCYESEMRFPTDPKLLWEWIEFSHKAMCGMSEALGLHRPRTKYLDVLKANLTFRKQCKHTKVKTRMMTRRLLDLLGRILSAKRRMERENPATNSLSDRDREAIDIIMRMYRQQRNHFESNNPKESIPDRIVSVNKPYVRPIVRGNEIKNVEFGAKCNNIQVDGISFIETFSFKLFNEGTRLIHCINLHKRLFGVEVKKLGGDRGYAGGENRKYCKTTESRSHSSQGAKRRRRSERRIL